VVGDGPEGFAISPTGEIAVAILLRGSNAAKSAFFYNRNGSVAVLKIDGKKITKVGEVEVRGLPEGAVFSPDGKYLYVGNYMDDDISILRVDGTVVSDTGKRFKLPGHPASLRSSASSRAITAAGVPPVAMTPVQPLTSNSGKPDSTRVGASGNIGLRSREVTASRRILPALICGAEIDSASNMKSTSPARSAA